MPPDLLCFTNLFCEDIKKEVKVANDPMANINIAGKKFLKKNQKWMEENMLPINGSIEGVNTKARAKIVGTIILTVKLYSGKIFDIQFYVSPDYDGDLLMGFKQLNSMNALIDCRKALVHYGLSKDDTEDMVRGKEQIPLFHSDTYSAIEYVNKDKTNKHYIARQASVHIAMPKPYGHPALNNYYEDFLP